MPFKMIRFSSMPCQMTSTAESDCQPFSQATFNMEPCLEKPIWHPGKGLPSGCRPGIAG